MRALRPRFQPRAAEPELLSDEDRLLIDMIARGLPDHQIGHELGISETTVGDRLLIIFRKLAMAGLLDQLSYVGRETKDSVLGNAVADAS
jgi:DNA-binding NarL/FixJ family response regulator